MTGFEEEQRERLDPQTAREALFEVRTLAAGVHMDVDVADFACAVDRVALEGLQRTGPINFELSDALADRLTKALEVLQEIRENTDPATLSGDIDECLVLPPDIEAMVVRRARRRIGS